MSLLLETLKKEVQAQTRVKKKFAAKASRWDDDSSWSDDWSDGGGWLDSDPTGGPHADVWDAYSDWAPHTKMNQASN